MNRFLLVASIGLLMGGVALGCSCGSPRTATQVIVIIDADPGVRMAASNLHVEVFGAAAGTALPSEARPPQDFAVSDTTGWPRTLALAPENRDATRVYRVVATGEMGVGGTPVAVARVISGYVPNSVRVVRLVLRSSCPVDDCGDSETCGSAGTCIDAYIRPIDLPEYMTDAGTPMDASMDAPRPDGGADAPVSCAGGCDDGVACTTDSCVDDLCQHTQVDENCDDGVACTDDTCDATLGCMNAPQDTACDDGVSCTTDVCSPTSGCSNTTSDGLCVDDGNDCTTERCDAVAGCVSTSVMAGTGCDDGLFCDGLTDTCDASGTCVGGASPCVGMLTCDESMDRCVGSCADDSGCPPDTDPPWGACNYELGTCDNTGTRTRAVTTFTCTAGMCVTGTRMESDTASCARSTDGTTCGSGSCTGSGPCMNFTDACDESGTRPTSCTNLVCGSGSCMAQMTSGPPEACMRDTDGFACGGETCGPFSFCAPDPGECATTGTQSRTCTTPLCASATCSDSSMRTDTQSCGYDSDGQPCGACGACLGGACRDEGSCGGDAGMDAPETIDAPDAETGSEAGRTMVHLNEVDWGGTATTDFIEVHNAGAFGSTSDLAVFVVRLPSCMPQPPFPPMPASMAAGAFFGPLYAVLDDSFGVALIRNAGGAGATLVDEVSFAASPTAITTCLIGGVSVNFAPLTASDTSMLTSFGHPSDMPTDSWELCGPTRATANSCP